jgi:hypothetical protein
MITYKKHYSIEPPLCDRDWILKKAKEALFKPIPHITDITAPKSPGTIHDYYSNGDYWWPNPDAFDGLPYIRRDGETNPDNFNGHRFLLRQMRTSVAYLSAAFQLTKDETFAVRAICILKEFFLDNKTHMNPHLAYAQAIPGICDGRGIGIIDTLHLIDVPFAIELLCSSNSMTDAIYHGLKNWFATYLGWMLTSQNGVAEMTEKNNHSVCFFLQAAVFSLFTDNEKIADFCRDNYKHFLLPQMEKDGSFPLELNRTKPYNYSIFVLDNMVSLCYLLSKQGDDLWDYTLPNGAGIKTGLDFLTPYLMDKSLWPYPKDVMHFDAFPARASFMMFAGCTLGREELLQLFKSLPIESEDEEARRNLAVRIPWLWISAMA